MTPDAAILTATLKGTCFSPFGCDSTATADIRTRAHRKTTGLVWCRLASWQYFLRYTFCFLFSLYGTGTKASPAEQLSMALAWDRADIAQKDILVCGQHWQVGLTK